MSRNSDFQSRLARAYDAEAVTRERAIATVRNAVSVTRQQEIGIDALEKYAEAHALRRVLEETGHE